MQENFDKCLVRILVYEGGNDDDKRDPGGRTSRGILQREYEVYLKRVGKWAVMADHDVWKASDADIRAIYKTSYWDRVRGDELPAGVDLVIFDCAVNSGVSQAAKWVQRTLKMNNVDGDFGPGTEAAIKADNDNDVLIDGILSRRLAMLKSLTTWKYFGKGWAARVANVKKIGQAWASGSVGPDPVAVHEIDGHKKASPLDIKQPLIPVTSAQIASGAGTVATTTTQIVTQAATVVDVISWFKYVVGGLTIAAFGATAIATIAAKRAEAANNATATAEVDDNADANVTVVPVNDNTPAPSSGGASTAASGQAAAA